MGGALALRPLCPAMGKRSLAVGRAIRLPPRCLLSVMAVAAAMVRRDLATGAQLNARVLESDDISGGAGLG
jgi:hypothetical protein